MSKLSTHCARGLAAFALCCGLARAEDAAPLQPTNAKGWSEAAVRDINAAYDILYANHPGVYDKLNPGFLPLLKKARQDALGMAARVRNADGYSWAMIRFGAALGDGHAGVAPTIKNVQHQPPVWPGFVTAWRGNGLFVLESEANGIVRGAKVVSCDGTKVERLIEQNVFRFTGERAHEQGQWWARASAVFLGISNPFLTLPQACVFEDHGASRTEVLTWTALQRTSPMRKWMNEVEGETLPLGMIEKEPGLYWIALPTFKPDEQQRNTYRSMVRQIVDHRADLLGARAIVVDLRRNGGGSSEWGNQIAEALWGRRLLADKIHAYFKGVEVWWRASSGNTAYLRDEVGEARAEGRDGTADGAAATAKGMQEALDKGETYYVQRDFGVGATDAPETPALKTPVYVIVPGGCASACLDTLDLLTRFSNTKLIGAPSSADTNYLDARFEKLPSGLASLSIPLKVWVHRPRKSGEFYTPAITVTDLDWSTANFLAVVKKDLAATH